MGEKALRRYTNLAAALHVVRNRCLTLLNPATWDDRNDAYYLAQYKRRKEASSVLALCFAKAPETYHHWRVFSSGSDGVCIEFAKDEFENAVARDKCVQARDVVYKEVKDIGAVPVKEDDLPFLKRYPYRDELEHRLIYVSDKLETDFHQVRIPLRAIHRITLSPWMAAPLATVVKETIKDMKGCAHLPIYRSTLVENERWKAAANPQLKHE